MIDISPEFERDSSLDAGLPKYASAISRPLGEASLLLSTVPHHSHSLRSLRWSISLHGKPNNQFVALLKSVTYLLTLPISYQHID